MISRESLIGDLILGFRSKPSDLTEVLWDLGFKVDQTSPSGLTKLLSKLGFETYQTTKTRYSWYDRFHSRNGLLIDYIDGMDGDEEGLLELEPNLVAKAIFKGYDGKNDYDTLKQKKVMEFLRDHYNGVIYDPKEKTEVKEIRLDPLGCIRSRPKAYGIYCKNGGYK
ncbi:hypothetical protein J4437_00620 [Candidatus Woesearchaeota archaeon]|nr:hypothetical protein [Candidatus Woesearchaeota archaeon]